MDNRSTLSLLRSGKDHAGRPWSVTSTPWLIVTVALVSLRTDPRRDCRSAPR